MAKALFKLLLLAVLSLGAVRLPDILGGRQAALEANRVSLIPGLGGQDENAAQLSNDLAELPQTINDLENLDKTSERALEGWPAREKELLREAMPRLKFKTNTLTRSLGLAPGSDGSGKAASAGKLAGRLMNLQGAGPKWQSFSGYRQTLLDFYGGHQAGMAKALWLAPAMTAMLSCLLLLFKRYTLSMSLSTLLFTLANFTIWALSASVVMSELLTKQSLLAVLPRDLWLSPVVFLVVSCGLLRLADENYPFWNRTVTTLFTPITASCLAAGWEQAAGLAKTAIAAPAEPPKPA